MLESVPNLIVFAIVAGALWWALQPRYAFVVHLDGGVPRVTKGRVTAAFLKEVGLACGEAGVARGWVGGVQRGRRLALRFSRSIPPQCRQRLRNVWALHR
jgi:hypothetical protein